MISSCLCNWARGGQAAWQNTSSFTKVSCANRRKEPICPAEKSVSREIDALVTTSHLFWPNQRRKAASLLPIWLRNYGIFGCRNSQDATRGGRGWSAGRKRQDRLIHMLAWNFIANGSPALFCGKNHSAGPRRQRPMPTSAGR